MRKRFSFPAAALSAAVLAIAAILSIAHSVWSQDTPAATDRGRIEGTVTDAETGMPVSGVKVIYLIGYERPESPGAASVEAMTQADGRYSLSVPFGDSQRFELQPPAGYLCSDKQGLLAMLFNDDHLITRAEPVRTVNWSVKRGTVWRFHSGGFPVHSTFTAADVPGDSTTDFLSQSVRLDARGNGVFTLPRSACKVNFISAKLLSAPVTLEVEAEFLPEEAVEITTADQTTTIRDRHGRTARLTQATASIDEQGLRIQLPSSERKKHQLKGVVRDVNGIPVKDAVVRVWLRLPDGPGGVLSYWTKSGNNGDFRIPDVELGMDSCLLQCEASGSTYSAAMSKSVSVAPDTTAEIDVGLIELHPGRTIPIMVVDPLGRPVEGASVRVDGSDLQFRTDRAGKCDLKYLTLDEFEVIVRYGRQSTSAVLSSSIIADRQPEIRLTLGDIYTQKFGPDSKVAFEPLTPGTIAPEFKVQEWSDGRSRSLKELKGKVVVLLYWDTAADFCAEELTITSQLRERFRDRNIEFLGIHPPSSNLQAVQEFMKEQDWDIPTAIDARPVKHTARGQTAVAYGIQDLSFIIIGKDGRIALNWDNLVEDEATEAIVKGAAKALGIPLNEEGEPIDDSTDGCESCARIMEYVRATAIEAALNQ